MRVDGHLAKFREDAKLLTMTWKMSLGVPPGAVERVVSRCSYIGADIVFWRFGVSSPVEVAPESGNGGLERSWFMLEYDSYGQELVIQVWGDLTQAAAWATLSYVSAVVRDMTLQYPGLLWDAYLGCPDHPSETMRISKVRGECCRLV